MHANAAARRLVRDGELAGRDIGDLLTQTDLPTGRSAADLVRPQGGHVAVRLEVVPFGEHRAIVIHDGTPERLLDVERLPAEAVHQAVFGIAEALDAYLFSGELTPDGYFVGTFTGPGAEKLLGAGETLVRPDTVWDGRVHPDDYDAWGDAYQRAAVNVGEPFEVEYRLHGLDGVTRWIRERGVARTLTDGRVILDGVALDVTRERASAEQFQRLFELSNDLILAYDRGLVIRLINPAVRSLLGYEPDEVIGREWSLLVHPDDAGADYEQVGLDFARQAAKPVTVRCVTKDGRTRWFSWTGAYDPEDDLMLYVGRDVTGDVEHRTEMERQSRTDSLTGLANRRHLVDALHAELGRAMREGRAPGVVLLDLDRFKAVNDTHGHLPATRCWSRSARRHRAGDRGVRHGRALGRRGVLRDPAGPRGERRGCARRGALRAAIAPTVRAGAELARRHHSAGAALAAAAGSVERPGRRRRPCALPAKRRGRDRCGCPASSTVEDWWRGAGGDAPRAGAGAVGRCARGHRRDPLRAGGRPRGVDRRPRSGCPSGRDALPARGLAPRPRQDRHPRRHPHEARPAGRGRMGGRCARTPRSASRSCAASPACPTPHRRCATTTSGSTARAIRTASGDDIPIEASIVACRRHLLAR